MLKKIEVTEALSTRRFYKMKRLLFNHSYIQIQDVLQSATIVVLSEKLITND